MTVYIAIQEEEFLKKNTERVKFAYYVSCRHDIYGGGTRFVIAEALKQLIE